jgi:hypothetical protein
MLGKNCAGVREIVQIQRGGELRDMEERRIIIDSGHSEFV